MERVINKRDDKKVTKRSEAVSRISKLRKNTVVLCQNLCLESSDFIPSETVKLLYDYVMDLDRIFYSAISDYIFVLNEEVRGQMIANVERLYDYTFKAEYTSQIKELVQEKKAINALSKQEIVELLVTIEKKAHLDTTDCTGSSSDQVIQETLSEHYAFKLQKIVLKILDHINLATNQYVKLNHDDEYFERKIAQQAEKMNSDIDKKINDNSKENMNQLISLIGIFTALSFIVFGGLTSLDGLFSQIQDTHTLKLVLVGSLWGLAVFNLLSVFEYFISRVAGKRFKYTEEEGASFYQKYPLVLIGNTVLGTIFLISSWLYFIALEDMGTAYLQFARKHMPWLGIVVVLIILGLMAGAVYVLRIKKRGNSRVEKKEKESH